MFNSPLSLEKTDQIIALLDLPPSARVVDLGCGEGEFLIRVMERYGAIGHGIDPQTSALDKCRAKSEGRANPEHLHLFAKHGTDFDWPQEPFDLAICIGASHAFEGFNPTLRELKKHVRTNGLILMGDIFWKKRPVKEYSVPSSQEEWDHFEGEFATKRFRKALAMSDAAERNGAVTKTKIWRDAYFKWGRSTMGFGFYLYQNTDANF